MSVALRVFAVVLLGATSSAAYANAGIPMLALAWPAQWLAFIPVVFMEAWVGRNHSSFGFAERLKLVAIANAVSTFVGIPLAWIALVLVESGFGLGLNVVREHFGFLGPGNSLVSTALFVLMYSPWLPPIDDYRVVYIAFVILTVPFCVTSIWMERIVIRRLRRSLDPSQLYVWVRKGNIYSYFLLVVVCGIYWLSNEGLSA